MYGILRKSISACGGWSHSVTDKGLLLDCYFSHDPCFQCTDTYNQAVDRRLGRGLAGTSKKRGLFVGRSSGNLQSSVTVDRLHHDS